MKDKMHFLMTSLLIIGVVTLAVVGVAYGESSNNSDPSDQNIDEIQILTQDEVTVANTGIISYQGRLLKNGGTVTGTINITFRLYQVSTGGTEFWAETQAVSVDNGLFSVNLGAVNPLDNWAERFGNQVWLGIQPQGAVELVPRQQLGATGYAYNIMPGTSVYDTNPGVDAGDPYINSFWVSATNHPAIYGRSSVANGVTGEATGAQGIGVHGISTNNIGSFGETKKVDNNYGFYTPDNLYSFNIHLAGAIMQVVQNGGSLPIEPGDVVVFSGLGEPMQNGNLSIQVQLASYANSTAVAGVAYSRYNINAADSSFNASATEEAISQEITLSGSAAPGDYLLMVVQGPAQVKVSALDGGINPGDLLATGSTNGIAGQAAEVEIDGVSMTMPGVVFAKALEALESGEQLIYAYVILK